MSLNSTPSAERLHNGIFGRRNAGKSSIINALTGQELAIVVGIGTSDTQHARAIALSGGVLQSGSGILGNDFEASRKVVHVGQSHAVASGGF